MLLDIKLPYFHQATTTSKCLAKSESSFSYFLVMLAELKRRHCSE
uniref:Uncharacterized protein n=1 Tax=Rhizophora mucronata TaxID=61149 RepID=A0A2P2KZM7_RHIMU